MDDFRSLFTGLHVAIHSPINTSICLQCCLSDAPDTPSLPPPPTPALSTSLAAYHIVSHINCSVFAIKVLITVILITILPASPSHRTLHPIHWLLHSDSTSPHYLLVCWPASPCLPSSPCLRQMATNFFQKIFEHSQQFPETNALYNFLNLKLTSSYFLYVLVFFSYIKNFPAMVFILSAGLILIVISDILVDLLLSLFLSLNVPTVQSVI